MENIADAELIELAPLSVDQINFQFQFWLSITFALITASFVARDHLSKRVRIVLAILYLTTTLLLVSRLVAAGINSTVLTAEIIGRGIEWFPGSTPTHAIFQMRIIIFGVCSSLWFLYSTFNRSHT